MALPLSAMPRQADGSTQASPAAIALSGKVESVDKMLTFLGIGFLAALSDVHGRKPLMAWSAVGFALTNLIQATTVSSVGKLYLADFVDGCSSCMLPICQVATRLPLCCQQHRPLAPPPQTLAAGACPLPCRLRHVPAT